MVEYSDEQLNRIDALVAEKVMGWHLCPLGSNWDTAAGWEAAESAPDAGWKCTVDFWHPTRIAEQALWVFEQGSDLAILPGAKGRHAVGKWSERQADLEWYFTGHSLTTDICLAALKKAGAEVLQ